MDISNLVHYYKKNYDPTERRVKISSPQLAQRMQKSPTSNLSDIWIYKNIVLTHKDLCLCLDCIIPEDIENNVQYWGPESKYGMPDKFWQDIHEQPDKESFSRFSTICDRFDSESKPEDYKGHSSWKAPVEVIAYNGGALDLMPSTKDSGVVTILSPGTKIVIYEPKTS